MNSSIKDENGNIYYLENKLNSGGQGCVFTVHDNESIVIKAMVDEDLNIIADEEKYLAYKANIRKVMSVGEFENLAIPYVMLEKPYCGYIMKFMNGLQSIDKLMLPYLYKNKNTNHIYFSNVQKEDLTTAKTKEEFDFSYNFHGGVLKRLKCLAKLAKILGHFEDKNVVYCDLSPNNVYVSKNPDSYEAWLIDLDNLSYEAEVNCSIGTPSYMAPEVVKGEKNTIYSDRYSFALIAHRLLLMKEPFLGKAEDDYSSWDEDGNDGEFEEAIANGEVAWIWEKDDDSNRSTTGLNPYDHLNQEIIDLFERTLNADGRHNPKHRPSMWEWYGALVRASESSFSTSIKFSEPSFENLIEQENKKKYYYMDVNYISKVEPFQKEHTVKRYVVNIKLIRQLIDDEGNIEYIAEKGKLIYWNSANDIMKYNLSNYDVMNILPAKYIYNFISIKKDENLFSRINSYSIFYGDDDYEVVIVENGKRVKKISNLLDCILYIKYKGILTTKITIERE